MILGPKARRGYREKTWLAIYVHRGNYRENLGIGMRPHFSILIYGDEVLAQERKNVGFLCSLTWRRTIAALIPALSVYGGVGCKARQTGVADVKVIDGTATPSGAIPSIFKFLATSGSCTGTKIADRLVLT